ncbi:hypothetical protein CL1_0015 [Thermococcus cleftensis]|uniref:Uncharacterized protein n=2 Tax=Thermococcus cleftensis (strain DSM 27260 / KACC 17922 / CL1) TaxID=163003 RepID=I3ZR96_THECF|nr:hypothetical protein CL1_0015 [Thermococcus cleftensis]
MNRVFKGEGRFKSVQVEFHLGEKMEEVTEVHVVIKTSQKNAERLKIELAMLQGRLNVEEALKRARGAMKGAKPWQELEAEMYDELVP